MKPTVRLQGRISRFANKIVFIFNQCLESPVAFFLNFLCVLKSVIMFCSPIQQVVFEKYKAFIICLVIKHNQIWCMYRVKVVNTIDVITLYYLSPKNFGRSLV